MKNVRSVYEVSTAHIPKRVAEGFDSGVHPYKPTMSNEYGWLFRVPEDLNTLGVNEGSSLWVIFSLAQDANCDWVLFDRDVEPVEYLQIFEW